MQEVLLNEAAKAGAEVWRGAAIKALSPGVRPEADIAHDSETCQVEARLVVGADGREIASRQSPCVARTRDPPELFIGGFQLSGKLPTKPALYLFLHGLSGRACILIQNQADNYRIYLLHHMDALPRRLSGEKDYPAALAHFEEIGVPASWLESATPHGILATFDGAHRWIARPARDSCVLIGDAAAASDPVWGNGLSRTLRDVRLLRDRLHEDSDWSSAAGAYAADHDVLFQRLRRAERLSAALHFSMEVAAEARRKRAYLLMAQNPELNVDMSGLGPEARCSDFVAKTLLGDGEAALL